MIPQANIIEWSNSVPWQTNEQVEQDLVICRALVEIFNDDLLATNLAFRGGTALHKLYLHPQPRYSEDIDLVQISEGPFGEIIDRLREVLSFLGKPVRKQKENNNTLIFSFQSEMPPVQTLRVKVETNCREHFTEMGWIKKEFAVQSSWFKGNCSITTYYLEELLGTKTRALYQRRKGRDLYDLYKALTTATVDAKAIITCYNKYMQFSVEHPPTKKMFLDNMDAKISESEFLGDITALLRPTENYNSQVAYDLIKEQLIELM
jgi:predicted nucleotidyltransferase component of viral defense system